MGILLGLASALCWGSADLMARFAARSIGTFRTMLYMQLTGLALLSVALPWLGGWGHLADGSGWRPWMWGSVAGVLNALATLALYRSFEIGKMSVVAPISSAYPALTTVLAVMTGERLAVARIVGIVVIIAGVLIVAHGEQLAEEPIPGAPAPQSTKRFGVGWAILSAIGFGVLFWLLGIRVVPQVGSVPTVWIIRLISVLLTALLMLFAWRPAALPAKGTHWILGVGVLDTGAYVLATYGMKLEQVSVVGVLTSLYGAVTVGLAATVLRERISRVQWMGIGLIFIGIVLINR